MASAVRESPVVAAMPPSAVIARLRGAGPWIWGVLVAIVTIRFYFRYGPGQMHLNHEGVSYVHRVVEFLSCLRAGYAFPEWAVDFRGGLGSPYFAYYQPGFFYVASAFAALLPVEPALGVTLIVFSVVGYAGLLRLVGERFGTAAGILAGTMLLMSPYSRVEVYVRGDLSEYCGMMMLPVALWCLVGWMEQGRQIHWFVLSVACGVLIAMHPAAALLGYGMLGLAIVVYGVALRSPRRAVGALTALLVGGGLAAFFWLPVALEWHLVQGYRAATGGYAYFRHFVDPSTLIVAGKQDLVPVKLTPVMLGLIGASSVLLLVERRTVRAAQWRLVVTLWLTAGVSAFMMGPASRPVWEALPLLQRIQFPWRVMLVITVALATLSACTPAYARTLALAGIAVASWTPLTKMPMRLQYAVVETRADLLRIFVRPDAADEWLPWGARPYRADDVPREARCDVPECRAEKIEREPGHLRTRVTTPRPASVVLPHYFFPIGWKATRNGVPVPLARANDGLMRLVLPAGDSVIDVAFTTTPRRWVGVGVSAITLVGLLLGAVVTRRREAG